MLKNLSRRIGFTETEIKVILFLIIVFIAGFSIKNIFNSEKENPTREFDYSEQDSLFSIAGINPDSSHNIDFNAQKVDYKQEVLDFNKTNFQVKKDIPEPEEKSINLNTAEVDELVTLPGIGEKTAQNIVKYRSEKGPFSSLSELLNVKGIGQSKYNKIIKYLFIQ